MPVFITLFTLLLGINAALAAEETLSGDAIQSLLPTIRALGKNTAQTFDEGGNTDYFSGGNLSKGRWSVQGDKYCSVWPPVTTWRCYGVAINREAGKIFWISDNGEREENRFESR